MTDIQWLRNEWARLSTNCQPCVREAELGLLSLCGLVRPGCLVAPAGPHAGRSGSVRCAAGQYGWARLKRKKRSPTLGHSRGGFSTQIHNLGGIDGAIPCVSRDGASATTTQVWVLTDRRGVLPDADAALDLSMMATPSAPSWRTNPQPHIPERYKARNTWDGLHAPRGRGITPCPGFSVLGNGLDLAEIPPQYYPT